MVTNDFQDEHADRLLGSLNYHLGMLGELTPYMVEFDAKGPSIVANACLESFLTHARLLIEFIAGRKSGNQMTRHRSQFDFQPSALGLGDWEPSIPTYFDGYLERIDKHVAHLSQERVMSGSGRWWAFEQMARSLFFEYGLLADRLIVLGRPQNAIAIKTGIARAESAMASAIKDDA